MTTPRKTTPGPTPSRATHAPNKGPWGLRHIVRLVPDLIKVDMSTLLQMSADLADHEPASSLIGLAIDIGATPTGVETEQEVETPRRIGIGHAQGSYLARPGQIPSGAGPWGRSRRFRSHHEHHGLSVPRVTDPRDSMCENVSTWMGVERAADQDRAEGRDPARPRSPRGAAARPSRSGYRPGEAPPAPDRGAAPSRPHSIADLRSGSRIAIVGIG
jgi:hypothetical protein